MLTPADIGSKQFTAVRFREGYDQDEVDAFLDDVQAQLQVTNQELAKLQSELETLRRVQGNQPTTVMPPVPAEPPAPSAAGILAMAQETADKHVSVAKFKGESLVSEAEELAEAIKGAAVAEKERLINAGHVEAARLKTEGVAEKQRVVDELEARHGQVAAAVDRLLSEGTKIREALNEALARYEAQVPR